MCKDISASKCVPSGVVLSSFHQDEDQALTKSPRTMVNKDLVEKVLLQSSSKSDRKFSNSILK